MSIDILSLKSKMTKTLGLVAAAAAIMVIMPLSASAHCDTMEGPTVSDGFKALETGNVNYTLKWIQPQYEQEIKDKFNLVMKMKDFSPEAKEVAEQYFFSELVRVHRTGEGAPFDGLKPYGTPVDEVVAAADESIAAGNLSPINKLNKEGLIPDERMPEITERFEKVMSSKDFDVNDLEAGREYIESYVKFFKYAEGEEEHGAHGAEAIHEKEDAHDAAASHQEVLYTVKSGDTLWQIALKYDTTYRQIANVNKISNPHMIYPGQTFIIPIE
ncbi:DUF6448 family protein [Dehalobacterium formicoaceticum]|uniref:DUF6448 family protein n=1 Tax=Dehalobacterium formicoaceticum TaxID=51515 RepID=UPI001FA921C8|nr:DUF6448 family protein [Dehalobacterium formicoaceticum]